MTAPMLDLARRAVACRDWRWMPGMLGALPDRRRVRVESASAWECVTALPDLTDPATLGCLLALVRDAWSAPWAQASPRLSGNPTACVGWMCYLNDDEADRRFGGASEAEALIAALEAAAARAGGAS